MDKIPILILSMERPLQLIDMVDRIVERTYPDTYRIIICDNGSTDETMIAYLKSIENRHTVIYNNSNMIFEGLNEGLKLVDTENFIITDPDILINQRIDADWTQQMVSALRELSEVPKIGIALNTEFGRNTRLTQKIYACEGYCRSDMFYIYSTKQPCCYAPIDTTMCMYRRDTFTFWNDGILRFDKEHGIVPLNYITQDQYNLKYPRFPVRIGGTFAADHMGWYVDSKYLPDLEYYKSKCNPIVSSTLRNMYDLIREHHGI